MGSRASNTSALSVDRSDCVDPSCPDSWAPESSRTERPDDDLNMVRALEEYLRACELGAEPERATFLAQHQAIAPRLADCLESLAFQRLTAHQFADPGLVETGPFPE